MPLLVLMHCNVCGADVQEERGSWAMVHDQVLCEKCEFIKTYRAYLTIETEEE